MPRPPARLFIEVALDAQEIINLDAARSHYLVNVMRLGQGDGLSIFNGRQGEWNAVIEAATKKGCKIRIANKSRSQVPEPDLWLVFAPVKKTGTNFIVEKATELGVSRLCPVFTKNTKTGRINHDRFRATAVEAAEQCRRLTVPDIDQACLLTEALTKWPADRTLLLADESGGGVPITQLADKQRVVGKTSLPTHGVLIGPEGGCTDAEWEQMRQLKFVTLIDLGPRILRAETAALSALACWQALIGDWYGQSHH